MLRFEPAPAFDSLTFVTAAVAAPSNQGVAAVATTAKVDDDADGDLDDDAINMSELEELMEEMSMEEEIDDEISEAAVKRVATYK